MSGLPPNLRARILEASQREASDTRAVYTQKRRWLAVVSLALSGGIFAVLGGPRAGERSALYVGLVGVTSVAMLLFASVLASKGRTSAAPPGWKSSSVAVGLPLVWAGVTALLLVVPGAGGGEHAARHDAMCAVLGIAMGVSPFVTAVWTRKGTVFGRPRWVGAALGALSFTLGASLMTLACPCSHVGHMAFGHVLPASMAGALFGWLAGPILAFRPR